jgi:hypothetical protein
MTDTGKALDRLISCTPAASPLIAAAKGDIEP